MKNTKSCSRVFSDISIFLRSQKSNKMIIESDGDSSSEEEEVWEVVGDVTVPSPVTIDLGKLDSIQIPLGKQQAAQKSKVKKKGIKKRDRVIRAYTHFTHLLYVSSFF
jgi:autotransporter translocation and assembly factor TamB